MAQGQNLSNALSQATSKPQSAIQALQKWKAIGSFSSMTSLSDIIMNQKAFNQNQGHFPYQFYTPNNNSRPMSKQNSSNNLFAPLSISNMNKFNSERTQFPKIELFNHAT